MLFDDDLRSEWCRNLCYLNRKQIKLARAATHRLEDFQSNHISAIRSDVTRLEIGLGFATVSFIALLLKIW